MMKPLSAREKRAVGLVVLTAVLIAIWRVSVPAFEYYQRLTGQRHALRQKIDTLFLLAKPEQQLRLKTLSEQVPVLEMPQPAAQQGILLRDELTRQLQRCGIQAKTLQLRESSGALRRDGFRVLLLDCQGRCSTQSLMQLIEQLKQNPYYVAVEKLSMKVDPKERSAVTFQLVVSTYAKG
ncbi:MAG: hypothetical protein KBI46_02110 [Phycisphaerae bacterium]|nr:hypothetical protein [Phycisphaerae bacterium]